MTTKLTRLTLFPLAFLLIAVALLSAQNSTRTVGQVVLLAEGHDGTGRVNVHSDVVWTDPVHNPRLEARWPKCDNGNNNFLITTIEWSSANPPKMVTGQECFLAVKSTEQLAKDMEAWLNRKGLETTPETMTRAYEEVLLDWARAVLGK